LRAAKVSDITPRDITRVLDALGKSSADQALASLRAFFKWCIRRHYIEKSPCELMTVGKPSSRARVLTTDELKAIWRATDEPGIFSSIVRLLILWGQRPREVAALRSDYIADGVVTLPEWLCKNGRAHNFPVGPLATTLLAGIEPNSFGVWFPARGKPEQPFNGWSKSQAALNERLGKNFAPWQLRDIRRTYRTIHAQIGTPPHIAERLINHVSSTTEVEKIYDRFTYMPDMRIAVEKYHSHLATILPG
jgi:integrase